MVIENAKDLFNFAEENLKALSQSRYQSENVRLKRKLFFTWTKWRGKEQIGPSRKWKATVQFTVLSPVTVSAGIGAHALNFAVCFIIVNKIKSLTFIHTTKLWLLQFILIFACQDKMNTRFFTFLLEIPRKQSVKILESVQRFKQCTVLTWQKLSCGKTLYKNGKTYSIN